MKKYNKLSYIDCVQRGKDCLEQMKTAKYDICLLALRICEIKIGGNHKGYSIKRFAEDIGMSHQTLRKWLEEHRNVTDKLGIEPKEEDWRPIRKTFYEAGGKDASANKVRQIFNKYKNWSQSDYTLDNCIKYMKAVRNFCQDHDLSAFDSERIQLLEDLLEVTKKEFKKSA